MALFSQEMFEVFEEKSEPVSLTGKKRKRQEAQDGDKHEADQKKSRVNEGEGEGSASDPVVVEEGEPKESTEDLSGGEDDLTREEPM